MNKIKLIVSMAITAFAVLFSAACENGADSSTTKPPAGFTFTPVILQEGVNAVTGVIVGYFDIEGVEFYSGGEDDKAGRDNEKFEISGSELVLAEDLYGGFYYVKFGVPSGFTLPVEIGIAFAEGPADIEFEQPYRLMTGTAMARGEAPIVTFTPEGGMPPYSFSLVDGDDENDAGNGSFEIGVDGIYAKSNIDAGTYRLYVRCTDRNGKYYQEGIVVVVADYAPPFQRDEDGNLDERDFVRFGETLVNGLASWKSPVFIDRRNLTIPAFELSKYEVTEQLWYEIAGGTEPSAENAGKPKMDISWLRAVQWLNKLSETCGLTPVYQGIQYNGETAQRVNINSFTGQTTTVAGNSNLTVYMYGIYIDWEADGYRLPCDAEWELAARGGIPSSEAGSPWLYTYIGTNDKEQLLNYANCPSSGGALALVGTLLPNTAGLYDMAGNASEWVGDIYTDIYGRVFSADPLRGPDADSRGMVRIIRGGSFRDGPQWLIAGNDNAGGNRTSYRDGITSAPASNSSISMTHVGFRIARTVTAGN